MVLLSDDNTGFMPHRIDNFKGGSWRERVVGSFALDDVKKYSSVYWSSTSEKPERTLLFSVHAEGAMKELRIVHSIFHFLKYVKIPNTPHKE